MAQVDDSTLGVRWVGHLFAEERIRQFVEEGFTKEHDDEHADGEIADAAACYAVAMHNTNAPPAAWPWEDKYWKPDLTDTIKGRQRELIKAGALLIAEIQRLERLKHTA